MKYDIIIIGGGASGLCTAIMSKTDKNSILVIEHGERVGKKLLSTGNGKCNLTNLNCKTELFEKNPEGMVPYRSNTDISFVYNVINRFDCDSSLVFFKKLGLLFDQKTSNIYPRSNQASSVLDILRFSCENLGVDILCGYQPLNIRKENDIFYVDDNYESTKLVLSTGGLSASKTGSDGSGYEIAKHFGHSIIKPLPALCALKCSDPFFKELAGVRCDAKITLYHDRPDNKEPIISSFGNLQLNDYGISGIPTFQISEIAGRLLNEGKKLLIKIDFLPEFDKEELVEVISGKNNKFIGILNKKLANVIIKESHKAHPSETKEKYDRVYVNMAKNFKVHPVSAASFEDAQTTSGGVSLLEVNSSNMMSKITNNLFFTGEILDVSGICGGYNLQWAWSSSYVASEALKC